MEGFYEVCRENLNELAVHQKDNHTFPSHYHSNLEVLIVKSGGYTATVNGETLTLSGGSLCVADSYDIHSYQKTQNGVAIVVIIPYKYLRAFNSIKGDRVIKNNLISDCALVNRLYEFATANMVSGGSELYINGVVTAFLGILLDSLEFKVGGKGRSVNAIKSILSYVYANYQKDITRQTIANALGYSETYLSKLFMSFTGEKLSSYINSLRYEYVNSKIKDGSCGTLTELIYEAGFQSAQTFFRTKKRLSKS